MALEEMPEALTRENMVILNIIGVGDSPASDEYRQSWRAKTRTIVLGIRRENHVRRASACRALKLVRRVSNMSRGTTPRREEKET